MLYSTFSISANTLKEKCSNKNAKSCYRLGVLNDQKNDLIKAAKYYRRACVLKYPIGCYKLAEMYLVGSGVKQSDKMFVKFMQKSCDLGYKKSCSFVAEAEPVDSKTDKTKSKNAKDPNIISIIEKGIGRVDISAKIIDTKKRLVRINASMKNDLQRASGWLSLSFPDISESTLVKSKTDGLDSIKSYPKGSRIYDYKSKSIIKGSYLLVEGDSSDWKQGTTKKLYIEIAIPSHISTLNIYARGTLKKASRIYNMPKKGIIGQQGFSNHLIKINIGKGITNSISQIYQKTPSTNSDMTQNRSELSRRDKLLLLDKLLSLSYFHRDRKVFEAQLRKTLFGEARYKTYIKKYTCTPKNIGGGHSCILQIVGESNRNNRPVKWEFRVEFVAKKDVNDLRITEINSLDLLE